MCLEKFDMLLVCHLFSAKVLCVLEIFGHKAIESETNMRLLACDGAILGMIACADRPDGLSCSADRVLSRTTLSRDREIEDLSCG